MKLLKYFIIFLGIIVAIINGLIIIDILKDYWYIGLIVIISLIMLILYNRRLKIKRTCIIVDTKELQNQFEQKFGNKALNNGKMSRTYKNWLIKNNRKFSGNKLLIIKNPKLYYQQKRNQHILVNSNLNFDWYCFFVISFFLPFFVGLIYISIIYWVISLPIITIIIISFIYSRERSQSKLFFYLDSEVKRQLFEIETGYHPLEKGKYSFKYKKWLISKEFG